MKRIFVTGMGMISSMGTSLKDIATVLEKKPISIGPSQRISNVHSDIPVREVPLSNTQLEELLNLSHHDFSRTVLLALVAAKEAVESSGISVDDGLRTGVITGTTVSGLDRSEHFFQPFFSDKSMGNIADILHHECGTTTQDIADSFGFSDYISTISTACSSSANAIALAGRLIATGVVDRVLCGGEDALSQFTLNGFNSMKILDRSVCRPFDETRSGLNLGEGAAFLLLESEESVARRDAKPIALLSGWGNRCDAYHQTASSPEGAGPLLAMQDALDRANLSPQDIDYINVHGTGTPNNDMTEGAALQTLFGEDVPPFSSTKVYTGHTLGAAGAIEAVLSILSLHSGVIFPTFTFSTPMKELSIQPVSTLTPAAIKHVLTNSFGFGGNDTSLIFSKE